MKVNNEYKNETIANDVQVEFTSDRDNISVQVGNSVIEISRSSVENGHALVKLYPYAIGKPFKVNVTANGYQPMTYTYKG